MTQNQVTMETATKATKEKPSGLPNRSQQAGDRQTSGKPMINCQRKIATGKIATANQSTRIYRTSSRHVLVGQSRPPRLTTVCLSYYAQKINERLDVKKIDISILIDIGFCLKAGENSIDERLDVEKIDYAVHVNVAKQDGVDGV